MALSHDQARELVCAICINEHGNKACRKVNTEDELQIKKVVPGYSSSNVDFPAGVCKRCVFGLRMLKEGKEANFLIPETYLCGVPRDLRSNQNHLCLCRWCKLARMNGPNFLLWQRKKKKKVKQPVRRLCNKCYIGVEIGKSHKCKVSTLDAVENLEQSIPDEVKAKLALQYLTSKMKCGGDNKPVFLTPAMGGHTVPVLVGVKEAKAPATNSLTHEEVIAMRTESGVSANSMDSILANLRLKYGRKCVEANMEGASVLHNNQYTEYFSASMQEFEDKDGKKITKPFVYCSSYLPFLAKVMENRGTNLHIKKVKIGGDNGKGSFKLTATLYDDESIACYQEGRRKQRKRSEGITGGAMEETGQNMILLLAVVPGIPESAHNIKLIFDSVGINQHPYILSADLKLLMPCFGLMSCSSSNPCLFCPRKRVKGKWKDDNVELRRFGSLKENYDGWVAAGSKYVTQWTSAFQSTVGPVLVESSEDTALTTVLEKVGMPTVHLLLATNDILRPHMVKFFDSEEEMMDVLKVGVGVVPHSYQGKDGAFEGPQCSKILNKIDVLAPYLTDMEGVLFLNLLKSFNMVKKAIFGAQLAPNWEQVMQDFSENLFLAHDCVGLPITPKLHIIDKHVAELVRMKGGALGRYNEAALEAMHSVFRKVWELYKVKDETSPIYLEHLLKATLRVNADNTRHFI